MGLILIMKGAFIGIGDSMKKGRTLFLLALSLVLCLTSCQTKKIYSVELNYVQETIAQYRITVFGNNGSTLYETTLDFNPELTILEDGILQMRTGTGNVAQYHFFDVVNNKVSPIYENPKLIKYGKIVYMAFDNQDVKLIVRDIFDESVFFKSYSRNFSKTGVLADILTSAVFLDENTLHISYLVGENFEEVQELLVL